MEPENGELEDDFPLPGCRDSIWRFERESLATPKNRMKITSPQNERIRPPQKGTTYIF